MNLGDLSFGLTQKQFVNDALRDSLIDDEQHASHDDRMQSSEYGVYPDIRLPAEEKNYVRLAMRFLSCLQLILSAVSFWGYSMGITIGLLSTVVSVVGIIAQGQVQVCHMKLVQVHLVLSIIVSVMLAGVVMWQVQALEMADSPCRTSSAAQLAGGNSESACMEDLGGLVADCVSGCVCFEQHHLHDGGSSSCTPRCIGSWAATFTCGSVPRLKMAASLSVSIGMLLFVTMLLDCFMGFSSPAAQLEEPDGTVAAFMDSGYMEMQEKQASQPILLLYAFISWHARPIHGTPS